MSAPGLQSLLVSYCKNIWLSPILTCWSLFFCREALEGQAPTLAVRDSKAVLEFPNGRQGPLTFDLFRLPLSEARKQLQELMFGLVGQVQTLEKRLQGMVCTGWGGWVGKGRLLAISSLDSACNFYIVEEPFVFAGLGRIWGSN